MKPARYTVAILLAATALCSGEVDWSHPPAGWKPVYRQLADGSWERVLVPDTGDSSARSTSPASAVSRSAASSGATTVAPDPSAATASNASTPASGGSTAEPSNSLSTALKNFDWQRELSAIPAFVALDVTPETIARPTTPRDFAASLLNGVDRKGVLQTGLAVETSPYQVFFGDGTSLSEYRKSYLTRLLYRTTLSLATAKATAKSDDDAQRLALGINVTLLDARDPYLDTEIDALHRSVLAKYGAPNASDIASGIDVNASDEELRNQVAGNARVRGWEESGAARANADFIAGLEQIRERQWGQTAWNVAWAPSWISPSGKAGDLQWDGSTAWTTFAYGFEGLSLQNKIQVLAHIRYRQGEHVIDPDDASKRADQDSLFAAASLRFHHQKQQLNLAIEGAYIRIWDGLKGDGHAKRLGGVVEKKIGENLWLVISAGQDFGGGGKDDELFALGALRVGTADTGRFKP
jgi:hypothetical protein